MSGLAFEAVDALQRFMCSIAAPYQGAHDTREMLDVRWDGAHWHGFAWVRVSEYRDTNVATTMWLGAFADACDSFEHCITVLHLKLQWADDERRAA